MISIFVPLQLPAVENNIVDWLHDLDEHVDYWWDDKADTITFVDDNDATAFRLKFEFYD